MSTVAYAVFTTKRLEGTPKTTTSESPPGVNTYVDALAALVPAEVLAVHALILTATTQTIDVTTEITEPVALRVAFVGLLLVSILLYVAPRIFVAKNWDRLDWVRLFIPPLAFVGWTMLQRPTAFDAILPILPFTLTDGLRTVIALLLAVVLGLATIVLAYQADQKPPSG